MGTTKEGGRFSRAEIERMVREAVRRRVGRDGERRPARWPARGSAHETRRSLALFRSAQARKIKDEIVAVGKKLWYRTYVDGNGGNISCRIGPNAVICTPTMCSKFDLAADELCLVDLDGRQMAGARPRTSEILLHLEIYKAVPHARAVVHCHPPHATAYSITGRTPPAQIIPEYEVFLGQVAVTPYRTPGTKSFAETVLPFVRTHNTVLLGNHGVVCWADTVTHAEWNAEVLETYCYTLAIASRLGRIKKIPKAAIPDLLAIKKRIGLPDPRFGPPLEGAIEAEPMERTIQEVTDEIVQRLRAKAAGRMQAR